MPLFQVIYQEQSVHSHEKEILILADSFPTKSKIKKLLNMIDYCGHEMNDSDYKEFIVDLGHIKKFNIHEVKKLEYIEIQKI